jgi:hypothetical protein
MGYGFRYWVHGQNYIHEIFYKAINWSENCSASHWMIWVKTLVTLIFPICYYDYAAHQPSYAIESENYFSEVKVAGE